MSENDRSKRTPDARAEDSTDDSVGHGIADVGARRQGNSDSGAERENPEIRRTQREGSQPREETPARRTARDNEEAGSRSTIPGNTSETGTGTPEVDPSGRAARPKPGMPPIGCTRTAGSLMLMSLALAATVSRLLRR